ncbi:MAG: DUF547 domain-containing protein [Rhodospirillales bacterium]|nr:DUF547 domain-containing protein [Rhodospirillales bacterium]
MRLLARFFLVLLVLAPSASAVAAPKAELWSRWVTNDPASARLVDHAAWDDFLQAYVVEDKDGINRVAYGVVSAEDRANLQSYVERLESVPVSQLSRADQLAYWINLYNALTVRTVLDHFPVASIRDIDVSPGLLADGPWGKKLARVENEDISLDDIEHRILRPIWMDPRIHYALNCAATGCPNLATTAFTRRTADKMLTGAARAFINHPRGAHVKDGRLTVSAIFDWYKADFGGTDETVIAHIKRFAEGALESALAGVKQIDGYAYDWSLNVAN